MPSAKISQLTAATAPLSTDLHALARSTSNRKLTTAALFNETITLADFTTLQSGSGLIPGRWYRVNGCAASGNSIYQILAVKADAFSPFVFVEDISGNGTVGSWAYIYALSNNDLLSIDSYGNEYFDVQSSGLTINTGTLISSRINAAATLSNLDNCYVLNCTFDEGEYNLAGATLVQSYFGGVSYIAHNNDDPYAIVYSRLNNTTISIQNGGQNLYNLNASNAEISISDGCKLTNCRFENVNVEIVNAAEVENLTIIGSKYSDVLPYYRIDGDLQSEGLIIDKWAGTVIMDRYRGSSTVRANLKVANDGSDLSWDIPNKKIYLAPYSIIGTYFFNDGSGTTGLQTVGEIYNMPQNRNHSIKLSAEPLNIIGKAVTVSVIDQSGSGSQYEVIQYHGIGAKVGQLWHQEDFLEIRAGYNGAWGDFSAFVLYGCHYD